MFSGLGLRLEDVVTWSLSKSWASSLTHWTTLSWDFLFSKWGT